MTDTPPIATTRDAGAVAPGPASVPAPGSRTRRPQNGWGLAALGAVLGAATGTLLWFIYARLAAGGAAIASLGVGFGAGLGLRLVGRRSGQKEGLVAIGVAAAGILAGELLARLVVPRILAEERGFTVAKVMELLQSAQVQPMDFVFYAAGLYFAYRVASLPQLPSRR